MALFPVRTNPRWRPPIWRPPPSE